MSRVFHCPACGAGIDRAIVLRGNVFHCPGCHEELRAQFPFTQTVFWVSATLSPLLSYAVGLRGLALVLVSLIAWLPIGMVGRSVLNRISPPKVILNAEAMKLMPPSVREVIREHGEPLGLNLHDKKRPWA